MKMKINVKNYFKKLYAILKKPEMSILPANIAFYFVLALIPLFTIMIFLASSFSISSDTAINLITDMFPKTLSDTIINLISSNSFNSHINILLFIAFIIATNGTYAIVVSSNTLYKIDKRDVVKDRIKAVILLIIILMLLLFLIAVPILGRQILELLRNIDALTNIVPKLIFVYNILKWPMTFLIIYFNLKLVYAIAPSKQIDSVDTTEGAFFTTVCWVFATALFSYYVNNFARYDALYGNLSTIIILMIWIYAISFIFVLGMAINTLKYNNCDK